MATAMEIVDDDFWLLEKLERVSISRKRKIVETSSSDYFSDSDELDSPTTSKNLRLVDGFKFESEKLASESTTLTSLLMTYLSDTDLRSAIQVSKLWNKQASFHIQCRAGNHPFLLLWKTNGDQRKFDLQRFVTPLEDGPLEIQAVLFVATSSMEQVDFPLKSQKFLPRTTCCAAFSDSLLVTAPNSSFSTELQTVRGNHGVQALCIPKSSDILIQSFSIPVWASEGMGFGNESDKVFADFLKTFATPPGLALKGMILLLYQENQIITDFVSHRLAQEGHPFPVPLVGGVVSDLICEDIEGFVAPLACIWGVYGTGSLKVSSVAFNVDGLTDESILFAHIYSHFLGMKNGFILMFYKRSQNECSGIVEKIRSLVPTRVAVMGIQSVSELSFQGYGNVQSTCLLTYPNCKTLMEDVQFICLLVAY